MRSTEQQSRIAALYREYGAVLCGLMQKRFRVPAEDSENLLHDIFASLMLRTGTVGNEEKWLIGAACNASRFYWRTRKENVRLTDDMQTPPMDEADLELRQILEKLPQRASDVLRSRYLEGLSGNEIAERYGMTVEYTHVLIHRSLEKARAVARETGLR